MVDHAPAACSVHDHPLGRGRRLFVPQSRPRRGPDVHDHRLDCERGVLGAAAAELQAQAVDKVEKKLQELPYLDRIESYSQPGGAFIRVILSDQPPPAKVKDLWYQVRKKVGDIRNELPPGITGPDFNDEYGDVYSALYMLTAEGL